MMVSEPSRPAPQQQKLLLLLVTLLSFDLMGLMSVPAQANTTETTAVSLWTGENDPLDSIAANHGNLSGDAGYGAGRIDSGFEFNGNGSFGANIEGFSGDSFTFHLWIKPKLSSYWVARPIFTISYKRSDTTVSVYPNGQLCVRIEWRHGGCTFSTGVGILKSNELSHLTIVKGGGNLTLYKNGVAIGSGTGSCCSKAYTAAIFGGDHYVGLDFEGMMDEIHYHNYAMSDEEVFNTYINYLVTNPNPQLQAELDAAYDFIDELQNQLSQLLANNASLEAEVNDLAEQNLIQTDQIFALETQIDTLQAQVNALEENVETLESKVDHLEETAAELREQIKQLETMVNALEDQVSWLEKRVESLEAELNDLKQFVASSLWMIEEDFRAVFKDPEFEIHGDSETTELQNLINAILNLNKGRKMGIYTQLQ